ncbi:helix-turn-helix domain-containing protein [Blastopirellula sp. J2-11]|uniref:helix-turn-helix domain-containing protein n=1 Tax=Blastopirellula sp. J2-11 TaxID=2943192 RepID=UPI0021CA9025|nr:helix-turn-helix domain-containing protein [Blastopirellula sp. J2-11]UUO09288.1 helix-turn-helix domain-containing protein [Blastopirellula sp. J2-11]
MLELHYTPQEVATALQVGVDRIRQFIASGELRAINLAKAGSSRPQWRIRESDLKSFEELRMNRPPPKITRRRKKLPGVIEFYK